MKETATMFIVKLTMYFYGRQRGMPGKKGTVQVKKLLSPFENGMEITDTCMHAEDTHKSTRCGGFQRSVLTYQQGWISYLHTFNNKKWTVTF